MTPRAGQLRPALRRAEQRLYDWIRSHRALGAASLPPVPWALERLGDHAYCLLITWRRDGTPVPTPVWFAPVGDTIVLRTAATDGKVKRIANDDRVLVCPCSFRGIPAGPPMAARATRIAGEDAERAEAALSSRLGFRRRAYARLRDPLLDPAYIEVAADASVGAASADG